MPWFKVDDGFPAHRKVEALQALPPAAYTAAITIWTLMGADCGLNLSDGVFSRVRARKITGLPDKLLDAGLAALVKVGLFDRADDECVFHDWGAMQPTKANIEALRAAKVAAGRSGGRASGESRSKQVLTENEAGASSETKQTPSTLLPDGEAIRARLPSRPDPTRPEEEKHPPTPASGGGPAGRKPRASKAAAQPELPVSSRPSIDAALTAIEDASAGRFVVPRGAAFDDRLLKPLQLLITGFPDLADWSRVGRWLASWEHIDAIMSAAWLTKNRDAFAKAEAWESNAGDPMRSAVIAIDRRGPVPAEPEEDWVALEERAARARNPNPAAAIAGARS